MINMQDFINKYQGQLVTDWWGNYKGECVSLVKRWQGENGWPISRGNAINWQYNGDGKNYTFLKNYWYTIPKCGDMAVFQVGTYGHIGIVTAASLTKMAVFNQNWPSGKDTDPAKITFFDYKHPKCVGFLRKI
jgi:surface antigen